VIPATPGGLGLVQASLTGLATFTCRLASYWVPLLTGPVAYGLFKIRYRNRPPPRQASVEPACAEVTGNPAQARILAFWLSNSSSVMTPWLRRSASLAS
jgi:hypothetical protein